MKSEKLATTSLAPSELSRNGPVTSPPRYGRILGCCSSRTRQRRSCWRCWSSLAP